MGGIIKISEFQFVLFDFDDTLVLSGAIHEAAYKSVLNSIGSDLDFDYTSFRGKDTVNVFEELGFTLSECRILSKLKSERYGEIAQKQLLCSPCALDVVDFLLTTGKRLGIVSNGSEHSILLGLRLTGLAECFEVVISRDHVAKGKPSPEGILMAMRHFDCHSGNTLFVDDSANGIQASNLAGVTSIKIGSNVSSATKNIASMCELLIEFRNGDDL